MKLTREDFTSRFAADTMAKLKARSQQVNQARVQKYGKGSGQELRNLSNEIAAAESEYADELEQLAVQVAKEMYPVVDKYNINIDAKIEPFGSNTDIPKGEFDDQSSEEEPSYTPKEKEDAVAKRELVNALSQGAGVRASTAYKGMEYYVDYLNDINPELVEKYDHILGLAVGGYDDDQVIASILARISNSTNMPGGSSYPVWDKEKKQWTVVARGINFPILMHEIGKGIYSVLGQQGFSKNTALNKATISAADKLKHEPAGLRYGKFMIDDIGDVLADLTSKYRLKDDRIRDLFFAEMYKLSYDKLYSFVENCINKSLTPAQEAWARQTMEKINALKEGNLKKAVATGALALGLAGNPSTAKAQNFQGLKDKFKAGITAVQNKIRPQQKYDTVKVQKDAPLVLAKFKNDKGVGYGYAESRDEQMAVDMARMNAKVDIMKKMGKTQMTAGFEEKDIKVYQNADETYAAEVLVVIGNM